MDSLDALICMECTDTNETCATDAATEKPESGRTPTMMEVKNVCIKQGEGNKKKVVKRNRDEIVSIPRSSVVCSICSDIMHAPHHLSCECAISFCKACISRWMATHDKCPVCNTQPMGPDKGPVSSGRQWGDAMDSVKRACPVNVDCRYRRGCYADTQHHAANECIYRKIECSNEGCGQLVVQKYMKDHSRLCTLKRCKNFRAPHFGCNVKGTNDYIKQHEINKCSFNNEEVLKQIELMIKQLVRSGELSSPFKLSEDVAPDDGDRRGDDLEA